MPSPIVTATLQSALLSGSGNVLAQVITAYKDDAPFNLNLKPIFHFVFFTLLNCPPNCLWQEYLESSFPSRRKVRSGKDDAVDAKSKAHGPGTSDKLDVGNTIKKVFLDQTFGATFNTVMFIAVMSALKGRGGDEILSSVRRVR
ncbi:MAG: hypothetical protein M1833_006313 [Piccolia ochrophora]|nr:MAG: hypothetical protein M1833_006313 [Piccolia ochrophora]